MIVATAATNGAQFPSGIESFEDDAGVVGEAAYDRSVEGDPITEALRVDPFEEPRDFRERGRIRAGGLLGLADVAQFEKRQYEARVFDR